MAHKTLINGTAYEISGGRTLVNGTGYSIDKGKTLVGGTAYEVGFGHPVTIIGGYNITGAGYTATIDDVSYPFTSAWSLETVSTASVTVTSLQATGRIAVNGEVVLNGEGDYTVDLSGATHISLYSNMIVMVITTYNIPIIKDVTVTVTGTGYAGYAGIEYNGVTYTSAASFIAKTGDLIRVKASNVAGKSDYYCLVTSDMRVTLTFNNNAGTSSAPSGSVGITTIPEGHALVKITSSGTGIDPKYGYVLIDGVTYNTPSTLVIPVGTVITCFVSSVGSSYDPDWSISLNGTIIKEPDKMFPEIDCTYKYTVIGNVGIALLYNKGNCEMYITEQ